jgi:hypothetical protein
MQKAPVRAIACSLSVVIAVFLRLAAVLIRTSAYVLYIDVALFMQIAEQVLESGKSFSDIAAAILQYSQMSAIVCRP